jgi:hypothetical protein
MLALPAGRNASRPKLTEFVIIATGSDLGYEANRQVCLLLILISHS